MASDMALTMATHAEMFFAIIVLLILVIVFLVYKLYSGASKKKVAKSNFNNLTTGGVNPLWWNGSGDAGYGGPVTREETRFQAAAFGGGPSVFNGGAKSGMTAKPMSGPSVLCGPGYVASNGQCVPKGSALPTIKGACKPWEGAAVADAQALSALGAFDHDAYGLGKLQAVVNAADSPANASATGLSDANLSAQLYHGGI